MSRKLNPLDTSWLLLETGDTPMHVGALLILRLPAKASEAYVVQLAARLRETPPAGAPWTLMLTPGLRRLRARWTEDPAPDLHHHVGHSVLPSPGGERELGVLVERLHSAPLDPERPPWECHLIEGLHGGRFAVYLKLHHALMDATSFVRLLVESLDDAAQPTARAFWALPASVSERARAAEALRDLRARALESARDLRDAFGRLLRAGSRRGSDLRAPYTAPRSALNVRIGPQRRVATQQYDRERLAAAARACGADEGELVLYLLSTVLRRFLKEHNALPEQTLVAALPGQSHAASIGLVGLGTQYADPRLRLEAVRASLRASREHLQALPDAVTPIYTLLTAAPFLLSRWARFGAGALPLFNVVIHSVYGPDEMRWFGNAKLDALYPMFPLVQNAALSISCLRYAGTLDVAFVGAAEALPRLQRMAVYMGQALQDLEELIAAGELQ